MTKVLIPEPLSLFHTRHKQTPMPHLDPETRGGRLQKMQQTLMRIRRLDQGVDLLTYSLKLQINEHCVHRKKEMVDVIRKCE